MKNKFILLSLLLTACSGNNNSSILSNNNSLLEEISSSNESSSESIEASSSSEELSISSEEISSEEISSEEAISSEEVSSSLSSSSSSSEERNFAYTLNLLRGGYVVRSTYSRTDRNDIIIETSVADNVLKTKKLSSDLRTVTETHQYENIEGDAYDVKYNIDGTVNYAPLMVENILFNEDEHAYWEDLAFDNVFKLLNVEDFVYENNKYVLDFEKLNTNPEKDLILKSLTAQLINYYDGYATHYFIKELPISLSLNVNSRFLPTGFNMAFEDTIDNDGYSETVMKRSIKGSFLKIGNAYVEALTSIEASDELSTYMSSLSSNGFNLHLEKEMADYSGGFTPSMDAYAKYDPSLGDLYLSGKKQEYSWSSTLVNFAYGYQNVSENAYKKYTLNGEEKVMEENEIEGQISSLILFKSISSSFFEKQVGENETTYTFIGHELLNVTSPGYVPEECFTIADFSEGRSIGNLIITQTNENVIINGDNGYGTYKYTYTSL